MFPLGFQPVGYYSAGYYPSGALPVIPFLMLSARQQNIFALDIC